MESLLHDIADALRGLRRKPTFALAAIACFILGLGANALMFSVVDTLFLRPPPYVRDPGSVVRVYVAGTYPWGGHYIESGRSFPEYVSIANQATSLSSVAAFWSVPLSIGRGTRAEPAEVVIATHSLFTLLGVHPALGRFFGDADDHAGAPPVVVLSDGFWARRFGRDSSALGQTLDIGGLLCTVIGIAPRGFAGVDLSPPDVWVPIAATAPGLFAPDALTSAGDRWLNIIGRLRSRATTQAVGDQIAAAVSAVSPEPSAQPIHVVLGSILEARGPAAAREDRVALWVGGMSVIVLLLACANVTNLLLARNRARDREIGIRLAIGARPSRIVRLLVIEGIALAVLGSAGALAVVAWGGAIVRSYFIGAGWSDTAAGWRLLGFTAALAVLSGFASAILPAWRAVGSAAPGPLPASLRESGIGRQRGIRGLLVMQVALSLTLLVGAGAFVRSVHRIQSLDLGLEPKHLLSITLDFRGLQETQDGMESLFLRLADAIGRVRNVQSVTVAQGSPLGFGFGESITLRDRPTPRDFPGGGPYRYAVTPDYFRTLELPLLRGRGFTSEDGPAGAPVTVVNETLAKGLWPAGGDVGQCVFLGDSKHCATVVGVVKDTPRYSVLQLHDAQFYVPLVQLSDNRAPTALLVRTSVPPQTVVAEIRRTILDVAPILPYVTIAPLGDLIEPQLKPWRLGTTMFTAYGGLALLLTVLGLYAVLAYAVGRRTREIGVRMALGAEAGEVRRMILGEGLIVTVMGVLIGVGLVLAGSRVFAGLLYDESPRDPVVILVAMGTLLVGAVAACWLPAHRATRVDPVEALRAE